MDLNPETVAEQLGILMVTFGEAVNLHLPIPISIRGVVEQTDDAAAGVLKLHAMLREQPLPETVALVAHGFLDAWMAATAIQYEMLESDSPQVREAAQGSYFWLCQQGIASIEFLKSRAA